MYVCASMKIRLPLQNAKAWRLLLLFPLLYFALKQTFLTVSDAKYSDCSKDISSCLSQSVGNDFISQYGRRFDSLHRYLPPETKLSYYGQPGEAFAMWANNYVLSQYFLAPCVLEDKGQNDKILLNLYASGQMDPFYNHFLVEGWHLEGDFGNGLILLSK